MSKIKSRKREHRFVVGYPYEGNVIYGKSTKNENGIERIEFVKPMTISQAKRYLKEMPEKSAAIFEVKEI